MSNPLAMQIEGYNYAYSRKVDLDLAGEPSNTYYIYFEHAPSPLGMEITSGTVLAPEDGAVAGAMSFTDPAATFVTDGVMEGHTLVFPDIEVGGHTPANPLNMVITSVSQTTLGLSGRIPSNLLPAAYTIYSPREGQFGYTDTRVNSTTRVYLGETTFNGSSHSVTCYRYLDKYQSTVTEITLLGSNYEVTFNHNLGMLPANFVIYFWENSGGAPTGNSKVLHVGDECVVELTKTTMKVRNRYADLVARSYTGLVQTEGYFQVVI